MTKYLYVIILVLLVVNALSFRFFFRETSDTFADTQFELQEYSAPPETKTFPEEEPQATYVSLEVPYVNEAPEDIWTGSWKNACEEATIMMVDRYYQGKKNISVPEAKAYLQTLFDFQQKAYGSDANSDVQRTLEVIESQATFWARIVEEPTVEAIKKELADGRPIIAFHRGFDLQNKNIPFLATGSSYHTTVIKGYDDAKQQFITHDPGDSIAGANHVYAYDLFMNSLHDYRYETKLADGPSRVLFTFSKNSQ